MMRFVAFSSILAACCFVVGCSSPATPKKEDKMKGTDGKMEGKMESKMEPKMEGKMEGKMESKMEPKMEGKMEGKK